MKLGSACQCLLLSMLLGACGAKHDSTIALEEPSEQNFSQVVEAMGYACGSLDCHGSVNRNLRIYSHPGLRLAARDFPCGAPTTPDEVDADYSSAIGLEPELTSEVASSGGAHPERLTLVRKARGSEKHVGGAPFPAGGDGDRCLTSWLAGAVFTSACDNALQGVQCGVR